MNAGPIGQQKGHSFASGQAQAVGQQIGEAFRCCAVLAPGQGRAHAQVGIAPGLVVGELGDSFCEGLDQEVISHGTEAVAARGEQ